jgi:hypothetical protein
MRVRAVRPELVYYYVCVRIMLYVSSYYYTREQGEYKCEVALFDLSAILQSKYGSRKADTDTDTDTDTDADAGTEAVTERSSLLDKEPGLQHAQQQRENERESEERERERRETGRERERSGSEEGGGEGESESDNEPGLHHMQVLYVLGVCY